MNKIKEIIERYNISLTIVGTAVVLSTMFGQCSYDYSSGDVDLSTNPQDIVEGIKTDDSVPKDED